MLAKNCTVADLQRALDIVNVRYAGNVAFRDIQDVSTSRTRKVRFTLKVMDSHGPCHRRGVPHPGWEDRHGRPVKPKHMAYACWHCYGHYFMALLQVRPDAVIVGGVSSLANPGKAGNITKDSGNWQDRNIGSLAYPFMYSKACDCAERWIANYKGE